MRILYLTSGFPYPLTSGYLRHYFLIKELAARHAVSLLSIVGGDFETSHAHALAPLTERVLTFPSANRSGSRRKKAVSRLASLVPGRTGEGPARRLAAAAASLAREERFDVVLISGKRRTYPALAALPGLPLVADICDAAASRIRGSLRFSPPSERPQLLLRYAQTRWTERRLLARSRYALFASCRDRDLLLGGAGPDRPDLHATIVPNGVDAEFWARRERALGRDTVVFTGAMSYPPNEDAALRLIESIMPRVWRSAPATRLWVVGRSPTRRLQDAAHDLPRVTVTGFVDDVRPFMERASVFAAPLRFGAGIQNKLLEALALELPVVSSSLAANGLRTECGTTAPIAVADDPNVFARHLVKQLDAARNGAETNEAGRRFVERHFVWSRSGEKLEAVLERAAAASERPRSR